MTMTGTREQRRRRGPMAPADRTTIHHTGDGGGHLSVRGPAYWSPRDIREEAEATIEMAPIGRNRCHDPVWRSRLDIEARRDGRTGRSRITVRITSGRRHWTGDAHDGATYRIGRRRYESKRDAIDALRAALTERAPPTCRRYRAD